MHPSQPTAQAVSKTSGTVVSNTELCFFALEISCVGRMEPKGVVDILSIGSSYFVLETDKRLIFARYDFRNNLFERQIYSKVTLQIK